MAPKKRGGRVLSEASAKALAKGRAQAQQRRRDKKKEVEPPAVAAAVKAVQNFELQHDGLDEMRLEGAVRMIWNDIAKGRPCCLKESSC